MAEENSKATSLEELAKKLNSKMSESGAKFTSIKQIQPGQYELTAEINPAKVDQRFFYSKDQINALVRERKIEPGSLLTKLNLERQRRELQTRLHNAKIKEVTDHIQNPERAARLRVRYRDALTNDYLDLRESDPDLKEAVELYERSSKEYLRTGMYGTTLDLLSNFAATGFYNEVNNTEIKEFFDSWTIDVRFLPIVKQIFHNLFKYSVCYIFSAYGDYSPHLDGLSSIPGKDPSDKPKHSTKATVAYILNEFCKNNYNSSLDFNKFSSIYDREIGSTQKYPILYSILDPKHTILTPLGFFNSYTVTLKNSGMELLKEFLKEQEDGEIPLSKKSREYLRHIPKGLRDAALNNEDYTFNDDEISVIFLRKDDFEKYSKPRGSRAFDSFDYKDELRKADFATIDGISNYILKVTVGDKDEPVTDMNMLTAIAEAFDTPQKAFTIVWNHTLQIEKITASETGHILGNAKYEPVENDIAAALGITRSLIDGTNLSSDAAKLATKALQSEIRSAREQAEEWIYNQYKKVAKAAGFNTYPVVRWNNSVINTDSDAVTRSSYMQMLDRKAISIQTYMREQNLDFNTELQRMEEEKKWIAEGILQAGSPFQRSANDSEASPDQGRPKGMPTSENQDVDENQVTKRKLSPPSPGQRASMEGDFDVSTIVNILNKLPENELTALLNISDTDNKDKANKNEDLPDVHSKSLKEILE